MEVYLCERNRTSGVSTSPDMPLTRTVGSDNHSKELCFTFGKVSRAQGPWLSQELRVGAVEIWENHRPNFLNWLSYL